MADEPKMTEAAAEALAKAKEAPAAPAPAPQAAPAPASPAPAKGPKVTEVEATLLKPGETGGKLTVTQN